MSLLASSTAAASAALAALKAAELKQIAFLTGVNRSSSLAARKADLAALIAQSLYTPRLAVAPPPRAVGSGNDKPPPSDARILSIDMGIRNLAYCVVDISPLTTSSTITRHASSLSLTELCSTLADPDAIVNGRARYSGREVARGRRDREKSVLERVKLHAWKRTVLFPTTSATSTRRSEGDGDGNGEGIKSKREKESFDPKSIAQCAYAFLAPLIEMHQPTHILIERQRHRSNGMSAVLEWTVRVNMLESMFFAILETMQNQRDTYGSRNPYMQPMSVASADPKRIATFWTSMFPSTTSLTSTSSKELLATTEGNEELCSRSRSRARHKGDKLSSSSRKKLEKESRIAIVESLLRAPPPQQQQDQEEEPRLAVRKSRSAANVTAADVTAAAAALLECSGQEATHTRAAFLRARESASSASPPRQRRHRSLSVSNDALSPSSSQSKQELQNQAQDREEQQQVRELENDLDEKKLDDLSDCLLQALAWVQWDMNRHALLQYFASYSSRSSR